MGLDIRLLGPVEAWIDTEEVPLGGSKQRAVFAMLALHPNEVITADRLAEGLWGDYPPASAAKMVQVYVSRLRKVLPADHGRIVTHGRGYELRVDPEAIDASRFQHLVDRAAQDGSADGDAMAALGLWRGDALAEVRDEPFAAAEIDRLDDMRLMAMELAVEADVAHGRHRAVLDRLQHLLAEHPLRERLHAQKMLALYRSGRQAEALDAFQSARHALVEELGIEPGPDLRELHAAILRQDPSLGLPPPDEDAVRRRLVAGAERVEQVSGELNARKAQVIEDVVELQTIRELSGGAASPTVCPFKGLAPYEAADADYYFGRERLVAEMVAACVGSGLVGVIGPSGSGKSSAVQAGLLPALAAGTLPGSERWARVSLRPGEQPQTQLRRALGGHDLDAALERVPDDARLLVVVDQFEECFAAREPAELDAFLDALVGAGRDPARRALVVLSIRADFYGRCAAHPGLASLLAEQHVLVGPPAPDELRRAIEGPAARAGLTLEEGLSDALLADVTGEPGVLPLLSTALLELWKLREDATLRLDAYRHAGGVRGAVARMAEEAYDALSEPDRAVARRIFMRLAGEGAGQAVIRRRVALDELEADRDRAVARVLTVLADRRLVTVGDGAVEVAHEALLREWPRLRRWLDEGSEGRRLHLHLSAAARDWDARRRDRADLYRGSRLVAALDWRAAHEPELNALERDFLSASREAGEHEAAAARRTNRRLRALLAAAAGLLLLAVLAGVVAIDQRGSANRAALVAEAERLGSLALLQKNLDRSLLLARTAVGFADSPRTRGYLLASLLRSPAAVAVFRGDGGRLLNLAVSPDGRTLVTGDNDGTLIFSDTRTHRRVGVPLQAPGTIDALAFTPDGGTLAVAGSGDSAPFLWLVDPSTGRREAQLPGMGDTPVGGVAISPDGRRLAAAALPELGPVPAGIRIWDLRRPGASPAHVARRAAVVPGLSFTPDGRRLVAGLVGDGTVTIDVASRRVVRRLPGAEGFTVALSPDGRQLAAGQADGTIDLIDLDTGATRRASGRHDARIQTLAWTPDGRTVVSGGDDARVLVWDVGKAALSDTWEGHGGRVLASAVAPDGRTVYTGSLDGAAIAWDLRGDRRLGRPFTTGRGNSLSESGALSPDGATLAVAQDGGTITLVDTNSLAVRDRVRMPDRAAVSKTIYSPDGAVLAASGPEGLLALFDARDGRLLGRLPGLEGGVMTPGLGRSFIVTGGEDSTVRVWDRATRRLLGRPVTFRSGLSDVSLSPDERWFSVGLNDGRSEVWDVRTRGRVAVVRAGKSSVNWARFSPDGQLLVTGDADGMTRLWSTRDWRPVGRPLAGHAGPILSAAVSRDGRRLATSSTDGTVHLRNTATGIELGVLPGIPNVAVATALSPDGDFVFASYQDGRAYRWDIRPSVWKQHACNVASREPTRAEWAEIEPNRPYRRVCSG